MSNDFDGPSIDYERELIRYMAERRISRRQLLQRISVVGASAVLAPIIAACTSAATASPPPTSPPTASPSTPPTASPTPLATECSSADAGPNT